jgi:hypothetical protein
MIYLHLLDDVETLLVVNPAKDDVFPVQPGSLHCRDKELGSVRVLQEKGNYGYTKSVS